MILRIQIPPSLFIIEEYQFYLGDIMPVRQKKEETCCCHGGKLKILGLVLFLAGLMRYFNISWEFVLMVLGAFLLLKSLLISRMK
jgi:uncharacterized membrane protein